MKREVEVELDLRAELTEYWPSSSATARPQGAESKNTDIDVVSAISMPAGAERTEFRTGSKALHRFVGAEIPARTSVSALPGQIARVFHYDVTWGSGTALYFLVTASGAATKVGAEVLDLDPSGGAPRLDEEAPAPFRHSDAAEQLRHGTHPLQEEIKGAIIAASPVVQRHMTVSWHVYAAYTPGVTRDYRRREDNCTVVMDHPRRETCTIITSTGEALRKKWGSFDLKGPETELES
ncbi:hypothetical protein [Nesterenkonia halobia]